MKHAIRSAKSLCAVAVLGVITCMVAAAQDTQDPTSSYQYDANGNLIQTSDPRARVTNFNYDPLGRLRQQIQPPAAAGAARPTVDYVYDGLDQINSVTDPRHVVTAYTVDGLGSRNVQSSRDTGVTSYTYYANGDVKTRTDARGTVLTYYYDALNRLVRIADNAGVSDVFEYDGGASSTPSAIGHLTKMTDESGSTTFSYDDVGRLLTKSQNVIASGYNHTFEVSYAYGESGSANGKVVSVTYPSGNRLNYSYDVAGRMSNIVLNPVNANGIGTNTAINIQLLGAITYAPFGDVTGWQWGSGPTGYARTYDLAGRVVSYNLGNPATTGVQRTVSYDAAGRITVFTHVGASTAPVPKSLDQSFSYDDLNRLTGFLSSSTRGTYQYDLNGNRIGGSFGTAAYVNTVDTSSNRLVSTTGPLPAKTNSYDANGNLLNDGTTKYVYNTRNRMVNVIVGNLNVTQVFNGFGQRVQRSNGGGMFVYDEQGQLIGEYDTVTGNVTREIVYLGDLPVAVLNQTVTGTETTKNTVTNIFNIYPDHLGTPRMITRAADGKIVWRWDNSDPFGLIPPDQNPSGVGLFTFNLRMPGQYYDRDANLFYNYFRDYDPQTGRYVQSDPIGLKGGVNTYSYVGSDPIGYADPLGLKFGRSHPHCVAIRNKIKGLQNELDTRWSELVGGLPERVGPGESLRETMRGHRKLINKADTNLRYWEKQYDEDCDDSDEDDKEDSCKVCPSGTTVAKAAAGVGGAYIAYRCVRMIPSLLPPLWWTIPANGAIP
jgi:RHS repeat-associated protein